MRGQENPLASMFSYVSLEQRVPKDHFLCTPRALVDGILANMSALFDQRYSHTAPRRFCPSNCCVRCSCKCCSPSAASANSSNNSTTTFSINRDRLFGTDVARQFFRRVLHLAEWQGFVSDEHFSVDGTMIEAWAGHKSFVPKAKDGSGPDKPAGRNPEADFKGKPRSNATHQSTTDLQARLYKKGEFAKAKLRYMAHALSENRNGLVIDVESTQATGRAEWEAAIRMIDRSVRKPGAMVGADKSYDTAEFVAALERRGIRHTWRARSAAARLTDPRRLARATR